MPSALLTCQPDQAQNLHSWTQKTQDSQAVRQARQIFPEIRNSQAIQARNVFLPAQVEFLGPTMGAEQGILIVIVGGSWKEVDTKVMQT